MIPTAVKGHMPFLSTATRRSHDANSNGGSFSQQVKPKSPQSSSHFCSSPEGPKIPHPLNGCYTSDQTTGYHLNGVVHKSKPPTSLANGHHSTPMRSSGPSTSTIPSTTTTSSSNGKQLLSPTLDSPYGCLHLSPAKRDDILHKDHHWRDFLKALFKIKGSNGSSKKNPSTPSKTATASASDMDENLVSLPEGQKVGMWSGRRGHHGGTNSRRKQLRGKRVDLKVGPAAAIGPTPGTSIAASPLQRSHSMNATHKNLARLEAILEEEIDLEENERLDGIANVTMACSAPSTINRIRPSSEHLERKAVLRYLKQQHRFTPIGQLLWSDSDSSQESLHESKEVQSSPRTSES